MGMFIVPIKPMEKMELFQPTPVAAETANNAKLPFSDILSDAVKEYEKLSAVSKQDSIDLANGNAVDLAQIQINSMKTEAVLQTTVQVVTRAVNAYKEIMQIQV